MPLAKSGKSKNMERVSPPGLVFRVTTCVLKIADGEVMAVPIGRIASRTVVKHEGCELVPRWRLQERDRIAAMNNSEMPAWQPDPLVEAIFELQVAHSSVAKRVNWSETDVAGRLGTAVPGVAH